MHSTDVISADHPKTEAKTCSQVIVYTMGKVGSRSIDLALFRAGVKCWHIHTLSQKEILWHMERAVKKNQLPPGHIGTSTYLLQRNIHRPLYVSCVRDPVARNLSAFFQNLTDFVPDPETASPQYVLDVFSEHYPHHIPLTWFDREWKENLGIDIYEKASDQQPYLIFTEKDDNEVRTKALSAATGVQVNVQNANQGEQKKHGELYAEIKRSARLKGELADEIFSSRFVRRFWNVDEIDAMYRQWTQAH